MSRDTAGPLEPGDARRLEILLLALLVVAALGHAVHFDYFSDDAFISFRYAHNLAAGEGLVFNPGERVMGYSNLLWVLLLAGLESLGMAAPSGSRLLGIVLAAAVLWRVHSYVRRDLRDSTAAFLAIGLLAANGTFSLWILGGLEGPLVSFLLVGGVVAAMRLAEDSPASAWIGAASWFALAAITRPEAIGYAVPVVALLAVRHRTRRRRTGSAIFAGLIAGVYAAAACWAWTYYGDWLPNTYYAKAHPLSAALLERGAVLIYHFLSDYYFVPLAILVAWCWTTRLSPRSPGWFPAAVIVAFAVYFLAIGGDVLPYHRMWMWTMPLFALLFGEALAVSRRATQSRRRRALVATAAGLVVVLNLPLSLWGGRLTLLRADRAFVSDLHLIGRYLAEHTAPDTVVAANNIGVLGYESDRPILDMLGLTDRHIAKAPGRKLGIPGHESHDASYVIDRRPDIVFRCVPRAVPVPHPRLEAAPCAYPSGERLRLDPRFSRLYELRAAQLADGRFTMFFVLKRERSGQQPNPPYPRGAERFLRRAQREDRFCSTASEAPRAITIAPGARRTSASLPTDPHPQPLDAGAQDPLHPPRRRLIERHVSCRDGGVVQDVEEVQAEGEVEVAAHSLPASEGAPAGRMLRA